MHSPVVFGWLLVAWLTMGLGCGPATVRPPSADGAGDAAARDGDAAVGDETGPGDHGGEAPLPPDGPAPDTGPSLCAAQDGTTLALLTFDTLVAGRLADAVGRHPGQLVGGSPALVLGQPGCSKALQLDGQTHIEIPDSSEWDLSKGAVDLWVRFDAGSSGSHVGLVSRDALGTNTDGHFTIARGCDGGLVVRLQRGGTSYARCSPPVSDGAWVHVGVNFGAAFELWVDGTKATRSDSASTGANCTSMQKCGEAVSGGIEGNDNPWVIGASASRSDEAKGTPVADFARAAIDHLRISSDPRSFAAP